jgi:hypothetical protein
MTKIPTLYERLKPKVKANLKKNEGKYSSSAILLKTITAKTNGKKDNRQTNSRYARKAWLFRL